MSILSFAAAAGLGAAAVKVSERVMEKNPEGKPGVNDYIAESKILADELIEAGREKAPEIKNTVNETVEKVKNAIDILK